LTGDISYVGTLNTVGSVAISGGRAVVACTRTATNQFNPITEKVHFSNFQGYTPTDPTGQLGHPYFTLDVTGNKKVYIEIPENNVEDQSINTNQEGLNIGTVVSAATFPTHPNFIPLYDIVGGDWENATDLRVDMRLAPNSINLDGYDGDITATNATFTNLVATNATFTDVDILNDLNVTGDIFINGVSITNIITSGGSFTTIDMGEPAPATRIGDLKGAVFSGSGFTNVNERDTNAVQVFGDVAATEKVRIRIDNTVDTVSKCLYAFTLQINKV